MVGDYILIGSYGKIQKTKNEFKIASVFGDMDMIVLWKTPKHYWSLLQAEMPEILAHESVHIVLSNLVGEEASQGWDRLCPYTTSMYFLKKKLGRRK